MIDVNPEDSDLLNIVYWLIAARDEVLGRLFLEAINKETNGIPPLIKEFEDMHILNRFWRLQLGNLRVDTIGARECLVDCKDKQIWVENFIAYVLPVIVDRHLPRHC